MKTHLVRAELFTFPNSTLLFFCAQGPLTDTSHLAKNLSHHFLLLACVFLWMWDVAQSSSEITSCFTIAQCPTGGNHLDRMLGAVSEYHTLEIKNISISSFLLFVF